jgi:hypothetical protein
MKRVALKHLRSSLMQRAAARLFANARGLVRGTTVAAFLAMLAACGSTPVPPDWEANAHGALQSAVQAYLAGNTRVADAEMARARAEVSRTGRPALLARAELVMCAARVASLQLDNCPAYQALAADAEPAERAYAAFLYGNAQPMDAALLPVHYQGVATGRNSSIAALPDPLSRLISAAVLLQTRQLDPLAIDVAIDTASGQGWRRPLLAWLTLQAKRAEDAGDAEAARRIRRRMEIVAPPATR